MPRSHQCNVENFTNKMNSIKVIVHKVLVKGMFKHIQKIQGKIDEEHALHPPKTSLPRRSAIMKTPESRSRQSDPRKNSSTKNPGKIKSTGNANITRFNSENHRYLKVPKGESLDSHKFRRKNTSEHYASSITSRSNSLSKQKSSKKSSKAIVFKPSAPEKVDKISIKNIQPLKLSKRHFPVASFSNEAERSLDELKTNLLLVYHERKKRMKSKKHMFSQRNFVRSFENLSVTKLPSIKSKDSRNRSNFSRKSTGFSKSSHHLKNHKIEKFSRHQSRNRGMFMSQQVKSASDIGSFGELSEKRLRHMKSEFEEIMNYKPRNVTQYPIINFKHVHQMFNSPRVRFMDNQL